MLEYRGFDPRTSRKPVVIDSDSRLQSERSTN